MKHEKGKTSTNIAKGVTSTRSKLKQTAISTPIKAAPLTAKVNTTWNNVLNKNKVTKFWSLLNQPEKLRFHILICGLKDCANGKISTANKCEIDLAKNDPVNTLRYFLTELKNKIGVLLPGMRSVCAHFQLFVFNLIYISINSRQSTSEANHGSYF